MPASARGLHRYWPAHLGVALAIVVSLGFTFVTVSFRSEPLPDQMGRMTYEDRASFLGRGTGLAGGGGTEPLPGTSVSSAEARGLLESISEPLNLTLLVHAAVLVSFFGLIRSRLGAFLGLAGSTIGLVTVMGIRLSLADRAADAGAVLGEGLRAAFGPGAILVPAAFAVAGGWNASRLILKRASILGERDAATDAVTAPEPMAAEVSQPIVSGGRATPPIVRAVGWYLLGLLVLQIAGLIGAQTRIQPASLAWRLPLGLWQIVAGAGLVAGRRWAYPATLALGALSAVWYVVFLVIGGLSVVGRAPVFLLPMVLMGALLLAPFALLLRPDGRAWFAARG